MQLIVLGSGTSIPICNRASPSLALIMDNHPLLFDLGPGSLRQLTRAGIDYRGVGRIFLTHFHPDHTSDLIHFLFASSIPSELNKRQPFIISGPPGLADFINQLQEAYGHWLRLPSEIMGIEEFEFGEMIQEDYDCFKIIARPTKHTKNSIAYRVEDRSGKSIVYSGDTGFCEEIVELARGANLLVLECSFPEGMEVEGHLTPSLAGRIAGSAG
ncbi:MAG: ribonuclease Z, partial [Thermodesulfobacteriota bacterium]|nr:ribonuclease Z [Thermodesulfobacteriota bacterium]